jgi:REP element-mobilizing transposase RayT
MHERSKKLMKREGVTLKKAARKVACEKMLEALRFHGVEVIAICVGGQHWHALIRCPSRESRGIAIPRLWRNRIARHFMGIAKKESARALSREGLAEFGGVWAKGCGVKPIKDRRHQLKAAKYIFDHRKKGAAVFLIHP